MGADTKTVDVLAVLDDAIERVARPHEAGLHAARADIAELIERERVMRSALVDLKAQCERNLELGAIGTGYWEDVQDTIDAALRACGGA